MKKISIPVEVKELFEYDAETGDIIWKKHPRLTGKKAGTVRKDRGGLILQFKLESKKYTIQGARVMWYLHTGEDPGDKGIDHINGDRNDNRFQNLRLATHRENCWNRRGVRGYWRNRSAWRVDIRYDGQTLACGNFQTEEEASAFYKEKVLEFREKFAPY